MAGPGECVGGSLRELGDLRLRSHELPWGYHLYVADVPTWSTDTPCAALGPDGLDGEEDPAEARRLGLTYALDMQGVQGVLVNLRSQVPGGVSPDLALAAFRHYCDNDAFVTEPWLRDHAPGGRRP